MPGGVGGEASRDAPLSRLKPAAHRVYFRTVALQEAGCGSYTVNSISEKPNYFRARTVWHEFAGDCPSGKSVALVDEGREVLAL
jgi:hypothetical protein